MEKRQKSLLYFLCLALFVFSCKENPKNTDVKQVLKQWTGKKLRFPHSIPCHISGNETDSTLCNDIFKKKFKILLYVDSMGCIDCRLKLYHWKRLIKESNRLFHERVGFLIYFQPKSLKEIEYILARDGFDYPVFIDMEGKINNLNHFPKETQYQCFLLDKDNKVLIVGNPEMNPRIWELYKTMIDKN